MKTVGALSQRYKEIPRKMFMAEGEVGKEEAHVEDKGRWQPEILIGAHVERQKWK